MEQFKQRLLTGAAFLGAAVVAAPALAQESGEVSVAPATSALDAPQEAAGDIVVTGSRIRSQGFDTAVPTSVMSSEDIASTGFTELSQVLADLPGVSVGDSNIGQPTANIQNAGTSTVNLRGLGSNRTLVLIDGRRTVSNAANRNVVSLNTIPSGFVDRVDIITGAASAIYGSDAIAGVVNIITRSKLEGLRLTARAGTSLGASGNDEVSASATFGHKFADGRGYLLVGVDYEQGFGLHASDRGARASRSWTFRPTTNTILEPDHSSDIPGGYFRGGAFYFDEDGMQTGFDLARNGYNDRRHDWLISPRKLINYAAKLNFEVSSAFKPFVQIHYSQLDSRYARAPIGVRDTTQVLVRDPETGIPVPGAPFFNVGRISASNPFVPAAIAAGAPSSGINFRRRFDELGARQILNDRDTLRIWAGFNGTLAGDWFYEVSYSHGEFRQDQLRTNGVNLFNLRNALRAQRTLTGVQCIDAAARADGCVPINLFGVGSITPEAADYIRANSVFKSRLTQQVVQAYATGTLFQLPAGPLSMVVGGEYRREHGSLKSDRATNSGYTTNAGIPGFDDGFNAKEAFVELSLPLFREQPFLHDLNIDLAGRFSDYSQKNVGTVFSYRAGINWAPVRDLRFRAAYGTAQRAPDLAELYSPPRDDFGTLIDICSGVTATTAGTVAANCRRDPGIAATIATAGIFEQSSTNVSSPNGGNPGVKQETANTLTAGAVFSPRGLRGLDLAVDYYHIKVKGAIDSYSTDVIMRECYSDSNGVNNAFCGFITRNTLDGQLQQVLQLEQNLNSSVVSGIDAQASYRSRLDNIGLPGAIDVKLRWSHALKNETTFIGLNGPQIDDDNGEINRPKDVLVGQLGYNVGPMRFQWRARYYGPTVSSIERVRDAKAAGFADPLYLYYKGQWRHDLYVSLRPDVPGVNLQVYAGISNLFNNTGPDVPEGSTGISSNGYISAYGIAGRSFYAGITTKF
ncbi:MAG: TonB-dependent receptor [Sphingopyxis sp.]|uniref:TonB-dependent receptor domain-containing protein n=1 Tax=Sphingopyxis sp. TaxID=1908224 RepID=UPI002ABC2F4E|nr:TonB-dependent receptor [Sphingopyxis sp.]MDZ3832293.1 TonB-dependent receptor [Sphingopyxis sp.]